MIGLVAISLAVEQDRIRGFQHLGPDGPQPESAGYG